jgi:hypothetical protein
MEESLTEGEFALLLLSQDDLIRLGAVLGLQACLGVVPGVAPEPRPPRPLSFDA